jgi:hypothetical protein
MALASNLISARVRAWSHGGRERERDWWKREKRRKILGAVGYAGPISAAQFGCVGFWLYLIGPKTLPSLLSKKRERLCTNDKWSHHGPAILLALP